MHSVQPTGGLTFAPWIGEWSNIIIAQSQIQYKYDRWLFSAPSGFYDHDSNQFNQAYILDIRGVSLNKTHTPVSALKHLPNATSLSGMKQQSKISTHCRCVYLMGSCSKGKVLFMYLPAVSNILHKHSIIAIIHEFSISITQSNKTLLVTNFENLWNVRALKP